LNVSQLRNSGEIKQGSEEGKARKVRNKERGKREGQKRKKESRKGRSVDGNKV
jgi:hypothetical protein